jgi:capsular polysaccharide biosynthesis protein
VDEMVKNEKTNLQRSTGLDIRIFKTLLFCNLIPILIVMLVFGCIGFGISRYRRTTTYTASASIIVNSPNGIDQPGISADSQADMVEAVLTNGHIMNPALGKLNNKKEILQNLQVKGSRDDQSSGYSHVLHLSIKGDRSKITKNALLKIEKSAIHVLPANLNAVDSVQISPVRVSSTTAPSGMKYSAAFAILGLLLSILYILIREISNTTYYSDQVLSHETGIPVLGVIPNVHLVETVEKQKGTTK